MKVLVLGATGMVGHIISIYLKEVGYDVTVLSRKSFRYLSNINRVVMDITDFVNFKKNIMEFNYDVVINAIGILNQHAEKNKSLAVLLNSYLPHYLSDITKNMKTRIIHISTDCVFSGKIGGYNEISFRDGKDFYSRTKALGELENDKDLTFRNSIVGPDCKENGSGLFNWFMKQKGPIYGFTKVFWSGITSLTLAKAIDKACYEKITGLYHLTNNESVSKFKLLELFNKHFKENKIVILPSSEFLSDKSLINNRKDFSFNVPSYENMIIDMKKWIKGHKEIYSHYI
jgi:dTDP-4-dehydrorhamnose reductase